jgi:hypothetical protein
VKSTTPKGTVALATSTIGIEPNAARRFLNSSASEARTIWNYRNHSLTIDVAKDQVRKLLGGHEAYPRNRAKAGYNCEHAETISDRLTNYRIVQANRKYNRTYAENFGLAATAYDPDDMLRGYGHGYGCRINCQDGLTLLLKRKEDVTWGNRYKPGRYPESKTVTYIATLYSRKYDLLKTTSFSRRGKWLESIRKGWSLRFDLISKTKAAKLISHGKLPNDLTGIATTVHHDDEWTIVKAESAIGVQQLSAGTLWCTRQRKFADRYFRNGFYVAYRNGHRYAAVSENECKNAKNEDVLLPPLFQRLIRLNGG